MVSRVAVIALVAIVACPILLGYAMNLQEVTTTDYENKNESLNVTNLLQNGSSYSYVSADINQLNTNFSTVATGSQQFPILPVYMDVSTNRTSIPMYQYVSGGEGSLSPGVYPTGRHSLSEWATFYYHSDIVVYPTPTEYVSLVLTDHDNNTIASYSKIVNFYWDSTTSKLTINYIQTVSSLVVLDVADPTDFYYQFSATGGYDSTGYNMRVPASDPISFANPSAGFYFRGVPYTWYIDVPDNTRSALLTIDLGSIADPSYSFKMFIQGSSIEIIKNTTNGVVSWGFQKSSHPETFTPIYYDNSNISNNTYQILIKLEKINEDSTYNYYKDTFEFRYVGEWPEFMGYANYYLKYEYTEEFDRIPDYSGFDYISIYSPSNNYSTPVMRVDAAEFRAFEYSVIENQTYSPSDFKTNPSTTIKDVNLYGSSFTFGGNTYTVSDGNIHLGNHDIPVDGLVLSSIFTDSGYENRIGNTVVSTTVTPSTIYFNGKWSATISTDSLQQTTHTQTEWVAGSFGWNGIDHNFLIVGLITSVGAFIAVAIYARTSNKTLWPALIVCGAAAMLFFAML